MGKSARKRRSDKRHGQSVEEFAAEKGLTLVRPRANVRGTNKFLGSEHPVSKINPNGYTTLTMVEEAQREIAAKLREVTGVK